jgi:hypothetical protein
MPDDLLLTSYGANEAANYGHKPLVVMSYDEYKASVDREFFQDWERLRDVPLNKESRNER